MQGFFKKGVGSLRAENPRHGKKDQTTMEITETTKMRPPAGGQGRTTPDSDGVCLQVVGLGNSRGAKAAGTWVRESRTW